MFPQLLFLSLYVYPKINFDMLGLPVPIFLEGYICPVQPGPKFDSRGGGRAWVQKFSSFATSSVGGSLFRSYGTVNI